MTIDPAMIVCGPEAAVITAEAPSTLPPASDIEPTSMLCAVPGEKTTIAMPAVAVTSYARPEVFD